MNTLGRLFVVLVLIAGILWAGLSVALVRNSLFGGKGVPDVTNCSGTAGGKGPNLGLEDFGPGRPRLLQVLGDPASSGLTQWPGVFDSMPTAYDIDGNGVDEVIAQSNDTSVYVFNAATGRVLAKLPTLCPGGWYIDHVLNGVEVGVLNPGEAPSIVVADPAAFVTAWRYVPGESDGDHFTFERAWEHRVDECFRNPGMDAKPTLADSDGDGTLEVFVQTEEIGFFALNSDGSVRWKQCWAGGNSAPVVDDLNADGHPETIVASDSGFLSVLSADTGAPQWTFDATAYGIKPASVAVSPTVAELDGVAPKEVLFTARYAPVDDPSQFRDFHMAIFAVHQSPTTWQAELLWMRQPAWAHPLSYTHLIASDVDADGAMDIFGMDWNTIGHFPGHWENLGDAHVFRLDASGQDVWVRDVEAWWSNKEIELGDANNDGVPDLLVNGVRDGSDGLWLMDAASGEQHDFWFARPWKVMRGPSLFDLRHDGGAEIVFPVAPDEASPRRGALLILEVSAPSR